MDLDVFPVGRVLVLAVDDEPTAAAAAIRAATGSALKPTIEKLFTASLSGLDTDWLRSDLRVVIVHPSTAGAARAVGPSDDPSVALVTENASTADVYALADSAARAIDGTVAAAGAPYSLLEATALTLELLAGARSPADAHEVSLLASIGNPGELALVVATSRDDASVGSVDSYAWWTPGPPSGVAFSTVFSSLTAGSDTCDGALAPSTRLAAWVVVARDAGVPFDVFGAQCEAVQETGFDELFGDGSALFCLPAPPVVRADGSPACLVSATFADDAPCASRPGMLDPMDPDGVRRPRSGSADAGPPGRMCEIDELEGAAATACSETTTCAACTAGWCVTQTLGSPSCAQGVMRFVHGAAPTGPALLHVVCDVVP